ncbi:MAG: hypothetical protein J07AB43_05740 [Candidatus Nanosalina sp. J07AB43]|nr:MAG: hypothetical protein J07AB43_05740 [Candidatus Nanosalina sp. J07AB43]
MSYRLKPEKHELQKARETTRNILEGCKHELSKDKVLEVNLGAMPSGPESEHGARGTAIDSETAQIYFNIGKEEWREDLEKVVRKAFGKSWFYENMEMAGLVWQELLAETFSYMFLAQTEEREPETQVGQEWEQKSDTLKQQVGELEINFSWQLKWKLGEKLLQKHELEQLPQLTRKDVQKAGELLIG